MNIMLMWMYLRLTDARAQALVEDIVGLPSSNRQIGAKGVVIIVGKRKNDPSRTSEFLAEVRTFSHQNVNPCHTPPSAFPPTLRSVRGSST